MEGSEGGWWVGVALEGVEWCELRAQRVTALTPAVVVRTLQCTRNRPCLRNVLWSPLTDVRLILDPDSRAV